LLAMDLSYRGRADLAERLLRRYAFETDDFHLYRVIPYCLAFRASVRARVAAVSAQDTTLSSVQRNAAAGGVRPHLELAERVLSPSSRGALVLLCGLPGSGKSRLAEAVAEELGGVVISLDRVREHRLGAASLVETAETVGGESSANGLTRSLYEDLLLRADAVMGSGRIAILDASFPAPPLRQRAWQWAEDRGGGALLVETHCSTPILLERLARRGSCPNSLSNECLSLYRRAAAAFTSPLEWPADQRVEVGTDRPSWDALGHTVAQRVRRLLCKTRNNSG
jgi:predicted kinase